MIQHSKYLLVHIRLKLTTKDSSILMFELLNQFILLIKSLIWSPRFPESPPSLNGFFLPCNAFSGLFKVKGHKKWQTSLKCVPTFAISFTMSSIQMILCSPSAWKHKQANWILRIFTRIKRGSLIKARRELIQVTAMFNGLKYQMV